jgi:hypothetical protein
MERIEKKHVYSITLEVKVQSLMFSKKCYLCNYFIIFIKLLHNYFIKIHNFYLMIVVIEIPGSLNLPFSLLTCTHFYLFSYCGDVDVSTDWSVQICAESKAYVKFSLENFSLFLLDARICYLWSFQHLNQVCNLIQSQTQLVLITCASRLSLLIAALKWTGLPKASLLPSSCACRCVCVCVCVCVCTCVCRAQVLAPGFFLEVGDYSL